jgi:hypothetical protein
MCKGEFFVRGYPEKFQETRIELVSDGEIYV